MQTRWNSNGVKYTLRSKREGTTGCLNYMSIPLAFPFRDIEDCTNPFRGDAQNWHGELSCPQQSRVFGNSTGCRQNLLKSSRSIVDIRPVGLGKRKQCTNLLPFGECEPPVIPMSSPYTDDSDCSYRTIIQHKMDGSRVGPTIAISVGSAHVEVERHPSSSSKAEASLGPHRSIGSLAIRVRLKGDQNRNCCPHICLRRRDCANIWNNRQILGQK